MKITNELGFPHAIALALERDEYIHDSDYSVSELISSARITFLAKRHKDDMVVDVADRIFALLGKAFAKMLEEGKEEGAIQEERFTIEVEGFRVSGKPDYYKDGVIDDWKLLSVWVYVNDNFDKFKDQLSMYNVILSHHGIPVKKGRIVAVFRDWLKSKAKFATGRYPKKQAAIIEVQLDPVEKTLEKIKARVLEYEAVKNLPDEFLPACTPEEMWEKPTIFAVMKEGRKSALNAQSRTMKDAQRIVDYEEGKIRAKFPLKQNIKPIHYIQERKGTRVRCVSYCDVNQFCDIYKKWAAENPDLVEAAE